MQKIILFISSVSGAFCVILGAFGAHAFKETLIANNYLNVFETAVRYQFYHTLVLLFIGLLMYRNNTKWIKYSALALIFGTLLFSGSLYLLSLSGQSFWGAITPLGGIFLILGWSFLGLGILNSSRS